MLFKHYITDAVPNAKNLEIKDVTGNTIYFHIAECIKLTNLI